MGASLVKINFLVNEVFSGWEPTDTRLGGTEESVVKWAEELVKLGHEVTVYKNERPIHYFLHCGVYYLDRGKYRGGGDICINIKSPEVSAKEPTLYLTNETNATDLDLSAYAGVIWPSQWCVDNIPVNNKTFILSHGYDRKAIYAETKIPKQCLYASSPDRGLDTLLEVWPAVYDQHPDASLLVTYGAEPQDIPGVTFLGELDDGTMNELYRTSDIWCHPCNGGELFCITGKKAQVAGCIPVIIPTMALAETVERGFKTDREHYAQSLTYVLGMKMEHRDAIRQDVIAHANALTWEQSTQKLLEIIGTVLN
jgi:glycosyltransferase involved in cell wall biosynthesis